MNLYATDFNSSVVKSLCLSREFLMNLLDSQCLLSEVVRLMKLVMAMMATNATCECSSALKVHIHFSDAVGNQTET